MLKRHNILFAFLARNRKTAAVLAMAVMFLCAVIFTITGCEITQRGNKRKLVRYEPIQGDVEIYAENRTDTHKSESTDRKSKTFVLEEKLTLKTRGDVYHPNLMFFSAAVGIGMSHQMINSTQENGRSDGKLLDYNFYTQILKTKRHPITLHTNRSEGLVSRQFLGSLRTERESSGFATAWKSENWPMKLQYSTTSSKQDSLGKTANDFFVRDDQRLTYSLEHKFSESSHLTFDFERNDVSQQSQVSDIQTVSDRYSLLHNWSFGSDDQHRLDSFYSDIKQTGNFTYQNKRFQERLNLQHRDNFSTHYDLTMIDSQQNLFDSREVRTMAGFEHNFYKSITTLFDVFSSKTTVNDQGDTDQKGAILTFDYNKKNRLGTFLGTYVTNITDYQQNGSSTTRTVPSETHKLSDSLNPTIILNETNINTTSIVVTDETITTIYLPNDDYTVIPLANGRVQLVFSLTGTNSIMPKQVVVVSYTYTTTPSRNEKTVRQNLTFKQIFKNGISLYYEHDRQTEQVQSNTTTVIPDEYIANTYGVEYAKGGLFLLAEYRKEDSDLLPSVGKRFESRYSWNLTNTTRASLRSSWHVIEYGDPDPRNIEIFRAGAELNSRINDRLSLANLLEYQDEKDSRFGKTKGFQFNSEMRYNFRQINFTTGLEVNSLQRRDNKLDNVFIYCRLKRFF